MVVPYNVVPQLDEQVAAVFVEPVAANMGVVAPAPGFLAGLRAECDRVGALLVFDEVITGFRLGPGGAQAKYDVDARPDDVRQGHRRRAADRRGRRARATIMETLSPLGPVFQAGTLSGNPLATAAGLAALGSSTDDVYIELMARARRLAAVLGEAAPTAGLAAQFPVVGTLVGMYFGDGDAADRLRRGQADRRAGLSPRSSTPCCARASRSPPVRTRRCSSGSATPTTCSTRSAKPPGEPRPPPPRTSPDLTSPRCGSSSRHASGSPSLR